VTLLSRSVFPEHDYELSFLWEYRLAFQFTEDGVAIQSKRWALQIFNNMILFIPAGVLYREAAKKRSWKKAILLGAGISLSIELAQLIFKLGLFEFDDILNNTIGMIAGYWIHAGIAKIVALW